METQPNPLNLTEEERNAQQALIEQHNALLAAANQRATALHHQQQRELLEQRQEEERQRLLTQQAQNPAMAANPAAQLVIPPMQTTNTVVAYAPPAFQLMFAGDTQVNEFIKKYNNHFTTLGFTDAQKLQQLFFHVTGPAYNCLRLCADACQGEFTY